MKRQIVRALLSESHADGEKLPSVRALMKAFGAASATVQGALKELSKKSLIYTVPGKGCFWGSAPAQKALPQGSPKDSLAEKFLSDIRSGYFSFEEPLPSQKELAARYRVSSFYIRRFLQEKLDEGLLTRKGKGRFFFPEERLPEAEFEVLLVTRASPWGEFSPASEREMDFIRFVYRTSAKKRLKMRLLGFDVRGEKFVDRNGNRKKLSDYPRAIGILLSTLLMEIPVRVLSRFKDSKIPVSVWWEHPKEALPGAFLRKRGWAFFNSTFGKNPGLSLGNFLKEKGFDRAAYISPYHASSWSRDRLSGIEESGIRVNARTDSKFASPWDFRCLAMRNGPKYSIDLRAKTFEKRILKKLVKGIGSEDVWIPANDEIAGLLRELEEENAIGKIPYMVTFDNTSESYLLRLDSFDFNTEILVTQMFRHVIFGADDPLQNGHFREISGKVIEK